MNYLSSTSNCGRRFVVVCGCMWFMWLYVVYVAVCGCMWLHVVYVAACGCMWLHVAACALVGCFLVARGLLLIVTFGAADLLLMVALGPLVFS